MTYPFIMPNSYHHGDLRKAALEQALEFIQQRGEVSFTLREISTSLKVSHTAIYRHFQSKRDLLSHIAESGFLMLVEAFEKNLKSKRPLKLKFQDLGQTYMTFAISNSGHYRAMFHHELSCSKEQQESLSKAGDKAFLILKDCIDECMREGLFIKSDSLMAARSIWASMHGFCTLYLDGQFQSLINSPKELEKAIKAHLAFIQAAILN